MSDHSPIEWADATWNPVRGCTKIRVPIAELHHPRDIDDAVDRHVAVKCFAARACPPRRSIAPKVARVTLTRLRSTARDDAATTRLFF
jgi:hypothetical protein